MPPPLMSHRGTRTQNPHTGGNPLTNIDSRELSGWIGRTAVDRDGDKVGKIADVYLDDDTGQPEWLAVTTGMFGTGVSFVPLSLGVPARRATTWSSGGTRRP